MGCGEPSAPLSAEQPGPAAAECVRACVCVCEEDTKVYQMDFFCGFRPLLFTYVLINGILITLQTKEGERLSAPDWISLNFSLRLVGEVNGSGARGATPLRSPKLRKHCLVLVLLLLFYL